MSRRFGTVELEQLRRDEALAAQCETDDEEAGGSKIDFSSAGLYLCGLQASAASLAASCTTIAASWILPSSAVSNVRSLVLTTLVALLCVRTPLKIGRVRGALTVFNALRPLPLIYVIVLTIEQLSHACLPEGTAPSAAPPATWRRVVYHACVCVMAAAGLLRASRPGSESDVPFLITCCSAILIAFLPPVAVTAGGPLCDAPSVFEAADRILRAFLFSGLYTVHVYVEPPALNSVTDLTICVIRSTAASAWVLGIHFYLLFLPFLQATVALYHRFGDLSSNAFDVESRRLSPQLLGQPGAVHRPYHAVDSRSDGNGSDVEGSAVHLERDGNGVLQVPWKHEPAKLPMGFFECSSTSPTASGVAMSKTPFSAIGFGDGSADAVTETCPSASNSSVYSDAIAAGTASMDQGDERERSEQVLDPRALAAIVANSRQSRMEKLRLPRR